jgi:hypothetical protein
MNDPPVVHTDDWAPFEFDWRTAFREQRSDAGHQARPFVEKALL